jgi:hypothetical protein
MTMIARPTTYNGVEMRSRLEARVAAFLDAQGFIWEYEPRAFASGFDQYLPDFAIEGIVSPFVPVDPPHRLYLEVKGEIGDQATRDAIAARMQIIHASEPGAALAFASEEELEDGLLLVRWPDQRVWRAAVLVVCPCRIDLPPTLAAGYGRLRNRALLSRCSHCFGYALPLTYPRVCLPAWDA